MAATALSRETLAFIDEYDLVAHNSELRALLQLVDARVTPATMSNHRRIQEIVAAFRLFHTQYPYVVAPPHALSGRSVTTPLRQVADDQPLTLDETELAEHIGIFGRSGGGKTTCAHHFAHEAYRRGLNVVTIDGKDDARAFPVTYSGTIIIDKDTPIPLLEPPAWLPAGEARPQITKPLRETMWGGVGLEQVASESLAHTFARHARPSVSHWRDEVRALVHKGDTYTRRDRCDGLALRLDRLINQYPGIGTTPVGAGVPLDVLCTSSVYFGFGLHTPIEDFITQWLLELRFSYNRSHHRRRLNTFVLLDESNLLVHDKTIGAQAPLAATFPLLREFGIAVCLTAANYHAVPLPIRSSLYLQVALNLTDAAEANAIGHTFGLNTAQREYLDRHLTRGTGIAKLGDRWKHPILARIAPLAITKTVTPDAWRDAGQRTTALGRPQTAAVAQQPAKPPSTPLAIVAPPLALNTHEEALLGYAARNGIALTTDAFRELAMHPQAGTRAKKKLLDLALLEEERIIVHRGRGGTAVGVRPTRAGYDRAGIKRPLMRTGSLQHEWLIRSLARRIPKSRIELSVGGKSCDLVIAYNPLQHARLATFVGITPSETEIISVECEVSQAAKTGPANAARNTSVGIAHTIIATMTPLRRTPPGAIVVDVFALLEAL